MDAVERELNASHGQVSPMPEVANMSSIPYSSPLNLPSRLGRPSPVSLLSFPRLFCSFPRIFFLPSFLSFCLFPSCNGMAIISRIQDEPPALFHVHFPSPAVLFPQSTRRFMSMTVTLQVRTLSHIKSYRL